MPVECVHICSHAEVSGGNGIAPGQALQEQTLPWFLPDIFRDQHLWGGRIGGCRMGKRERALWVGTDKFLGQFGVSSDHQGHPVLAQNRGLYAFPGRT